MDRGGAAPAAMAFRLCLRLCMKSATTIATIVVAVVVALTVLVVLFITWAEETCGHMGEGHLVLAQRDDTPSDSDNVSAPVDGEAVL